MKESRQIFAHYDGKESESRLPALCSDLLAEQIDSWPRLRDGYQALKAANVRDVSCPGFTMSVQWNPQRIVSTTAMLDPASIRARPCFLCRENLPEAQRAILYRKEYVVLCNPAPIFARHCTIAHIHHRAQSIEPALDAFLTLIRDLSPDFTVFYNGPQSGASAPDHLHFQASPSGTIPVERDILADGKLLLQKEIDGVDIYKAVGMGRAILVLDGAKQNHVASVLLKVIAGMRAAFHTAAEPMMNLLGAYDGSRWKILIFPRARHRPTVYDLEGEAKILITPASVEMGGFFITPMEKDFRALDAGLVQTIFQDVSVDEKMASRLVDVL